MHITVSFKDHSSICTCMLIKKEKKINKKKTPKKKKILNDWAETRTSPQTNSLPMKGGVQGGGEGGQTRRQRSPLIWTSAEFKKKKKKKAEAALVSALRKTRLCLEGFCTLRATFFPQSRLGCTNRTSALQVTSVRDCAAAALREAFVKAAIRPANPGHFKVPYQHWKEVRICLPRSQLKQHLFKVWYCQRAQRLLNSMSTKYLMKGNSRKK